MQGLILGIETSCDETAAAVVAEGREILSNTVFSQVATHQPYGGVVPELASREHLRAITPTVRQAMREAGVDYSHLQGIAVTQGPGLAGALLVGISFAKALSFSTGKPLVAVNHLEGHIHSVLLELAQAKKQLEYPLLALVVSGGHTHLFLLEKSAASGLAYQYRPVGRTLDDAAGEAFDKVAKLLGLPYPGGPMIDKLAQFGNPKSVSFAISQVKQKIYRAPKNHADQTFFSFSGIKTAVLRYVELNGMRERSEQRRIELARNAASLEQLRAACDQQTLDLLASFQSAVVDDIVSKTMRAAEQHEVRGVLVTGGVSANSRLRERFAIASRGLPVFFPRLSLTTDNAAMIAAAAYPKLVAGDTADSHLSAQPNQQPSSLVG